MTRWWWKKYRMKNRCFSTPAIQGGRVHRPVWGTMQDPILIIDGNPLVTVVGVAFLWESRFRGVVGLTSFSFCPFMIFLPYFTYFILFSMLMSFINRTNCKRNPRFPHNLRQLAIFVSAWAIFEFPSSFWIITLFIVPPARWWVLLYLLSWARLTSRMLRWLRYLVFYLHIETPLDETFLPGFSMGTVRNLLNFSQVVTFRLFL